MYRKGVSALIINKNQEILLVNLVSFDEIYFAIPGGGIEEGESLEEAVYREIQEELGIEGKFLVFAGKSNSPLLFRFKEIKMYRDGKEYEGSERHFMGFRFIGSDNDIKLKKDEVRSYRWVAYDELKDYLLFEEQQKDTQERIKEIFTDL